MSVRTMKSKSLFLILHMKVLFPLKILEKLLLFR